MKSKLIGKSVIITDKESMYYSEWGIVELFDGDQYHISIAHGTDQGMPIFDRNQFKICRKEN